GEQSNCRLLGLTSPCGGRYMAPRPGCSPAVTGWPHAGVVCRCLRALSAGVVGAGPQRAARQVRPWLDCGLVSITSDDHTASPVYHLDAGRYGRRSRLDIQEEAFVW